MVTDRDKYFFDLNGFLVLRQALSGAEVRELNAGLDAIPALKPGEWYGGVQAHSYGTKDGLNYQQIYEAGEPFERLIDHPSWVEHAKTFLGGQNTHDAYRGPMFIMENFANFRGPGEAIGMHSGGEIPAKNTLYRVYQGEFMVMLVNALIALTDIGPGDAATMLIPCSHKQNFPHPDLGQHTMRPEGASGEGMDGAIEVHMKAGDVLLFADTLCHGSARRTNPGQRRIIVYRYQPAWTFFRMGYRPTQELLDHLTPARREIVWPHAPITRTPNLKPGFTALDPTERAHSGSGSGNQ
jgi:hypothetical protein